MVEMLLAVLIGVVLGAGTTTAILRGRRPTTRSPGMWDGLVTELERARRYEHQFTLLRAELDRSEQLELLLSHTGDTARRSDCLWAVGRDLYVLLPEADRARAQAWSRRVAASLPAMRPDEVQMASFPEDGVTTRELLTRLHPAPAPEPHGTFDARWAS